jgi:hypothetical protein
MITQKKRSVPMMNMTATPTDTENMARTIMKTTTKTKMTADHLLDRLGLLSGSMMNSTLRFSGLDAHKSD